VPIPTHNRQPTRCAIGSTTGHHLAAQLSARPYNFYEPLYTQWWLFPSNDWPAYHHSKFFFHATTPIACSIPASMSRRVCPGGGRRLSTGRKFVMNKDWAWHRILAALQADKMTEAVVEVAQRTALPVCVEVDAGYVEDPGSYDPKPRRWTGTWPSFTRTTERWNLRTRTSAGEPVRCPCRQP